MISAMPIAVVIIIVSVGSLIPSLVAIYIEQAIPTQIEIMTIAAATIPTMKIVIATQPIRIIMTVPDNVVPVVSSAVTSMC